MKFMIFCSVVKTTGINRHETPSFWSAFVEFPYMRNMLWNLVIPSSFTTSSPIEWAKGHFTSQDMILMVTENVVSAHPVL